MVPLRLSLPRVPETLREVRFLGDAHDDMNDHNASGDACRSRLTATGVDSVRAVASGDARAKSTHSAPSRDLGVMAGAVTIAPVRATAEVASQRGARIQGLLFREVLPPRCAPLAPPPLREPSRAIDTVLLVIVCGIGTMFFVRLIEVLQ